VIQYACFTVGSLTTDVVKSENVSNGREGNLPPGSTGLESTVRRLVDDRPRRQIMGHPLGIHVINQELCVLKVCEVAYVGEKSNNLDTKFCQHLKF
jgi:hypothetical protein